MRSNIQRLAVLGAVLGMPGAAVLLAQDTPLPAGSVSINLPNDSPIALLKSSMGESRATARGSALVLDLHMSLTLRNASQNRIRGITLRVVSQELTLNGKGSVSYPSLNIGPGESFPARIDMQLMRPMQALSGPLVEVNLDGVLFQDLSFFGPDRLNSRRTMTAWEMEAERDREHFKRILASRGTDGLRQAMVDSLDRQGALAQLDVKVVRGGRSVASSALGGDHTAQFAFLHFPGAPVAPVQGWAQVTGNEASAPRVEVRNISGKPIRFVELGWILDDTAGRPYVAGSLPSQDPGLYLPPGGTARLLQDTTMKFSSNGQPVNIRRMTGYVSEVQFADGKVWVPSRENIESTLLGRVLAPSPEEQRLTELYRRKGLDALVQELNKF
jgi:hypothetical protein